MSDKDKIIERIKKMLALGRSPNAHEAEIAMRQAQKLMAKHRLSVASEELDSASSLDHAIEHVQIKARKRVPLWMATLVSAIADANNSYAFYITGDGIYVAGTSDNIAATKAIFDLALKELDVIVKSLPPKKRTDFCVGFSDAICQRLKESNDAGADEYKKTIKGSQRELLPAIVHRIDDSRRLSQESVANTFIIDEVRTLHTIRCQTSYEDGGKAGRKARL